MRFSFKLLISVIVLVTISIFIFNIYDDKYQKNYRNKPSRLIGYKDGLLSHTNDIHVWCIFARVNKNVALKSKFRNFLHSLIKLKKPREALSLHILCDNASKITAENYVRFVIKYENATGISYDFYDINEAAEKINDIVQAMMPYFSSKPGTYYSDSLFYMSLGLHRIAPRNQKHAIMIDCDVKFVESVSELNQQFRKFKNTTLFSIAPELTPVYRHILHKYRVKFKNTTFGNYIRETPYITNEINENLLVHPHGFPGYNSGVVLFDLERIRNSQKYEKLIKKENVQYLVEKYYFKGHLGDQDFFTLMGFEYPELIEPLSCTFNRQLCEWWRDRGYREVFDFYFKCDGNIKIYHGNCNTPMP